MPCSSSEEEDVGVGAFDFEGAGAVATERIASGAGTRSLDMQFMRRPRAAQHARLMIMDSTPHESNARARARLDYRTATANKPMPVVNESSYIAPPGHSTLSVKSACESEQAEGGPPPKMNIWGGEHESLTRRKIVCGIWKLSWSSQVKSSLYRNNRQPYGSLSKSLSNVLRKPEVEDGSRWRSGEGDPSRGDTS